MSSEQILGSEQDYAKQEQWQKTLENLDHIVDLLGKPIDENIKLVVASLNANGIPTVGSCGGHTEERLSFPYVYGEANGEPKYRYEDEQEITEGLINKYSLKDRRAVWSNELAEKEYYDLTEGLKETEEYRNWYAKNELLRQEVTQLIEDYYAGQGTSSVKSLHLKRVYPGYKIVVIR